MKKLPVILSVVLLVGTLIQGLFAWNAHIEIASLKNRLKEKAPPEVIYQTANITDEDVINYIKQRFVGKADSAEIIINVNQYGTFNLNVTTSSHISNAFNYIMK